MILDQSAGVRPRVIPNVFSEPMLIEDAVRPHIEQAASHYATTRFICLYGAAGSGKSWALRHLAKCFPDAAHVWFADDPDPNELQSYWAFPLAIYARTQPVEINHADVFQLAPWTEDDLIEYLLARHPEKCKSVMQRVLTSSDRGALRGNPETWSRVLDAFADDASLTSIREAVLRQVQLDSFPPDVRELIQQLCLEVSIETRMGKASMLYYKLQERDTPQCLPRPLHLPWVRRMVAARCLADEIEAGRINDNLALTWPKELVSEVASLLSPQGQAVGVLLQVMSSMESGRHKNAASLLHAMKIGWRPERYRRSFTALFRRHDRSLYLPALAGAFLAQAQWPKIDLRQLDMELADLAGADLSDSRLEAAGLHRANLRQARLHRASLDRCNLRDACLADADLTASQVVEADLRGTDFSRANLSLAKFGGSIFASADLSFAKCQETVFANARFVGTKMEGTDLSSANLTDASFHEVDLRETTLLGATFQRAELKECNLEDVEWPDADLQDAKLMGTLFSGSVMPRANLFGAVLWNTGLAEIQWEGADLRGADLRGATFHMGSSRSGLVGSPRPMEGSKTGFYVDDLAEQDFKLPEEIRKANLRGADLRGANIENVDFYLVDLRDALLDPDQRRYVSERGAIIDEQE